MTPKRLSEVDLPIKKYLPMPGARNRSATATSLPGTSGGPAGPWPLPGRDLRRLLARSCRNVTWHATGGQIDAAGRFTAGSKEGLFEVTATAEQITGEDRGNQDCLARVGAG